ncbi:serine incorporator 2 isoform X2 [Nyctibius grandis]|uniref:serine incorporator 2 isoform X2 n=1 Tax=Nyctibius grandis TaxID=48427 RepID=UPI0035BC068A
MGACLGVCSVLSCVSCLCGSAPCLLCGCCPSAKNSTVSRLLFTFFLFLGTLVSIIMIIPGVEKELHKLPGFCEGSGSVLGVQTHVDCGSFLGHKAVYRMGFAMAAFFFLFAAIMVCVRSSKDPRAAVQNGFWFFKFLVLVGITVGAFYIPDGAFTSVWFYFGVVGSFLFILIQLVLLIDFAHSWSQLWLRNAGEGSSKGWYAALCIVTFIFYATSIAAIVLLYVYYTKPEGCTEGKVLISINLILCLIISAMSILPKIQDAQPHSGLLQASLITLYTIYVTWSALANVPTQTCNPTLLVRNSTSSAMGTQPLTTWWDAPSIVGLIIFILCTLFIRLNSPISLSLSPEQRGSSPLSISVAFSGLAPTAPCPSYVGAPRAGCSTAGGSHESGAEGQNPLPHPAGHAAGDAAQDTVGFLGCQRTLPAHASAPQTTRRSTS